MRSFLVGLSLGLFLFLTTGIVQAAIFTDSVYGTVTASTVSEVIVGETIHLFDVTYDDDPDFPLHRYNYSGFDVETTYVAEVSTQYDLYTDAVFILSDIMDTLYSTYSGRDVNISSWATTYHSYHPDAWTAYDTKGSDFYYYVAAMDDGSWSSGGLSFYGPDNGYNYLSLNSIFSTPDSVPVPSTILLLGSGLAGLAFYRRKRK